MSGANQCKHGSLARSCEVCRLEAEVGAMLDTLQSAHAERDDLKRKNARLAEAVRYIWPQHGRHNPHLCSVCATNIEALAGVDDAFFTRKLAIVTGEAARYRRALEHLVHSCELPDTHFVIVEAKEALAADKPAGGEGKP